MVDGSVVLSTITSNDDGTHVKLKRIRIGAGCVLGAGVHIEGGSYVGSHTNVYPRSEVKGFVNRCEAPDSFCVDGVSIGWQGQFSLAPCQTF